MLVSGKLAMFVLDACFLRSCFFPQGGKKKTDSTAGDLGKTSHAEGV